MGAQCGCREASAQDGIDFADFLGLAREHLDLAEVVKYLETPPQPPSDVASLHSG